MEHFLERIALYIKSNEHFLTKKYSTKAPANFKHLCLDEDLSSTKYLNDWDL